MGKTDRSQIIRAALISLPSLLDGLFLTIDVITQERYFFNSVDVMFAALAVGWIGCAWWIAGRRTLALRAIVVVFSAMLLIGLAESGVRLLRPRLDPLLPRSPMRIETMTGQGMPGISGTRVFSVNHLGVRGPEEGFSKPTTNVLIVGGSAVECLYVTDTKSWPWLLGSRLTSASGVEVSVGNAGKSGHIVRHHEYLLRHYKHASLFKTVVVMCGVNDLGAFLRGDYDERVQRLDSETLSELPTNGSWYRRMALTVSLRERLARSRPGRVVQDNSGDWYGIQRNIRRTLLAKNPLVAPPETRVTAALDRYEKDLKALIALCRQRKQHLIFITQPTLYTADLPPKLELLLWGHTDSGAYPTEVLAKLMGDFNRRLMAVCRSENIECLDLAETLPKNGSVFYDDCHFNTSGCEQVASLVGDFLAARFKR